MSDGRAVTDARMWQELRRPELVRLFEENQFGKVPGRPVELNFAVSEAGTPAFGGKVLRRQVTVYFTKDKAAGPHADLLLYLPAAAQGPVPVILQESFTANNRTADDPGVKVGRICYRE